MHKQLVITHPGRAHQDEVLAVGMLLAGLDIDPADVVVVRREPTVDEVLDPGVYCVDVGYKAALEFQASLGADDPANHRRAAHLLASDAASGNYDHHGDRECVPAFRLVARDLVVDEACADAFASWQFASDLDHLGPAVATANAGVSGDTFRTASLVEGAVTAILAQYEGDADPVPTPLVDLLKAIGLSVLDRAASFAETLAAHRAALDLFPTPSGFPVLYGDVVGDPRAVQVIKAEIEAATGRVVPASVTRSSRDGVSWGLYRFDDDARLDFSGTAAMSGVTFAHTAGFLAQAEGDCTWDYLRTVVAAATVPEAVSEGDVRRLAQFLDHQTGEAYSHGADAHNAGHEAEAEALAREVALLSDRAELAQSVLDLLETCRKGTEETAALTASLT